MGQRMTTTETLRQIRDHLAQEPPETAKALGLAKNLLIQGACARELDAVRTHGARIVRELLRPALATDREKQARADRLARTIETVRVFDRAAIAPALQEMQPWMAALAGRVPAPEAPPAFPATRLLTALEILSGEKPDAAALERGEDPWAEALTHTGRILNQEQRARNTWEREREELLQLLGTITNTLADALALTGSGGEALRGLGARLARGEAVADPVALKDSLLLEAEGLRSRLTEVERRLLESRRGVKKFQELLRQADRTLQETRDDNLIDVFTGLPNRFALTARIERSLHAQAERGGVFSVIAIELDEYAVMVRELGRERVNRLMAAVAGRLASAVLEGGFLARYSDEVFVLLCPESGLEAALAQARRLRDLLDRTRFELKDADLLVRTGYGVVQAEATMTEESLLGLALREARTALVDDDGRPTQADDGTRRIRTPDPRRN